jgi:hypothetical protein
MPKALARSRQGKRFRAARLGRKKDAQEAAKQNTIGNQSFARDDSRNRLGCAPLIASTT